MSNPFKKVNKGEKLRIPAPAWNVLMDVASEYKRGKFGEGTDGPDGLFRQTGIILIKNGSGSDVAQFGVLGIDAPLILPTDNALAFADRVVLNGVTPADADHTGKFVVLLEPIKNGKIGRAYIAGACPAKVDFIGADDETADIKDADSASLKSGASGSAKVLWKEAGTGVKWAVVLLGAPAAAAANALFPVNLTQNGGANGNSTTAATYTYDVADLDANALGTAMAVTVPRYMIGPVTAATIGTGYYTSAGAFVLYEAFEIHGTRAPC